VEPANDELQCGHEGTDVAGWMIFPPCAADLSVGGS